MEHKHFMHVILDLTSRLLYSLDYKGRARTEGRRFTRRRKVSFEQLILFLIGNARKSLQVELDDFMETMSMSFDSYSKQAFSKQRQYIKPEAIWELFDLVATQFYKLADFETYRGYVVAAIDGSRVNLPDSAELETAYGTQESSGTPQIQALVSGLYDVLNGIFLDASFNHCHASERDLAIQHLKSLEKYEFPKVILLMDRGYPSAKLIHAFEDKHLNYVLRCPSNFISEELLTGSDCVIERNFTHGEVPCVLRILRFDVNGETEILATNIMDTSFTVDDFKKLYHMRWGIETAFDHLKNHAQLENFSGTTQVAVLQDFYATMFLLNVAQGTAFESREEFNAIHNSEENKHQYKLNLAQTIGHLKISVVKMLICESDLVRLLYFNKICKTIMRCATPIRPDRSFARAKKHKSRRHHNSKRRVL